MDKVLYKYRSLDNYKFFLDMIVNNRLWADKYSKMNDPMEGHYLYDKKNSELSNMIRDEKNSWNMCCLSGDKDSDLMWAHYGGAFKGIVLAVKVEDKHRVKQISYDGVPALEDLESDHEEAAIQILSRKGEWWKYEDEYRAFSKSNYIDVEILNIYAGQRMEKHDFNLLKDVVDKIKPSIKVCKHMDIIVG